MLVLFRFSNPRSWQKTARAQVAPTLTFVAESWLGERCLFVVELSLSCH